MIINTMIINTTAAEKIDKHDDLLVFFGFRVLDFVCVTRALVRMVPQVPLESSLHNLYRLRCIFKFTNISL
jgi:hypothetical protein